jgi:hypothetical protein
LDRDPEIKARFISKRHCPEIKNCTVCNNDIEASSTAISRIIKTGHGKDIKKKIGKLGAFARSRGSRILRLLKYREEAG